MLIDFDRMQADKQRFCLCTWHGVQEQRKIQQKNKAIQSSRTRLQDMLASAVEQYTQEELHLEQNIASKLADSTQRMSGIPALHSCFTKLLLLLEFWVGSCSNLKHCNTDLWKIMSDMHSQHLSELASKWQQYQALGQKLNEDHHDSLEKMAQMKQRYISCRRLLRAICACHSLSYCMCQANGSILMQMDCHPDVINTRGRGRDAAA